MGKINTEQSEQSGKEKFAVILLHICLDLEYSV